MDIIQKSIYKLKKIVFDYQSNTDFTPKRVLYPYGIVHKEDAWYVVGYSEERMDLRTFHCDRMSHVIISEEDYTIPEEFDLDVYWERSTRMFVRRSVIYRSSDSPDEAVGKSKTREKYPVLLQSDRDLNKVFAGFSIIEKEILTSGYRYKVDLISERTALNLLFLQLGDIRIIEPLDLREKAILIAKKILERQNS